MSAISRAASGAMPVSQVLELFSERGCEDVTTQLDLPNITRIPTAHGGQGDVYQGKLIDGTEVAIKVIRMNVPSNSDEQKKLQRIAHELYIWTKCKHRNILELIGVAIFHNNLSMISPWIGNSSLDWFISQNPQVDRHATCAQVAEGITHMHLHDIVHGDIKCGNILVSQDHTIKIIDFGSSTLKREYAIKFGTSSGQSDFSLRWAAPELLLTDDEVEAKPTFEADIYALGMTFLEIMSGRVPYYEIRRDYNVMDQIRQYRLPKRPEDCIITGDAQADSLWLLMQDTWAKEPQDRPRASVVRDRVNTTNTGSRPPHGEHKVRMETEQQKNERLAKEKEERERVAREKDEKEQKEQKENERIKEKRAKEEAECKAMEVAEQKAEEVRDAREKEEAKAAARAEAEAKAKEEAEKAKAEAEAKDPEAAGEEARDTVPTYLISSSKPTKGLLPSTIPDRPSPLSTSVTATPGRPSPLSGSTTASQRPKRRVPSPLDLTSAWGNRIAAPLPALVSARIIEDLSAVSYPEAIKTPNPDLNIAAMPGKFRYDRDFLLQFRNVCKDKPDSLPALDAIGLESDETGAAYPAGPGGGGRRLKSLGMAGVPSLQRQASAGLGLGPGLANRSGFAMGQFQPTSNSQSRFEASNAARGLPFIGGRTASLTPMSQSANQGGVGGGNPREAKRTRKQRGAGTILPSSRAGDLSQVTKISKPTGVQFGPSSVFSKKDANKRNSGIGRANAVNTFQAFLANATDGPSAPVERTTSSRKPSVALGPGRSPATVRTGEKRKLNLLPRIKSTEAEADKACGKEEDKEENNEAASTPMTEEEAQTKVNGDVKEYLGIEDVGEAIMALKALPSEHRHLFVDKLINAAMDGGNKIVVLAEKLFSTAHSRSVISPEGFERGLLPTIEMADDLSIDVPKTYEWLARMIHAAGLDKAKAANMAGKISVYGEPRIPPRELLMKEYDKVSSV